MDLSQMTVDDFMKTDWGSEDSGGEEEEPSPNKIVTENLDNNANIQPVEKTKKKKRKKKKVKPQPAETKAAVAPVEEGEKTTSHQQALDRLKEKDPDFYKFLQQEDSSLLKFDENEFDLDASSEEDDDDTDIHKLPEKLEEASDSDMDYGDSDELPDSDDEVDDVEVQKFRGKDQALVTEKMIENWKSQLMESKTPLPALRDLMKAFHSAIARFSQDRDENDKKKKKIPLKYKVETGSIFNAVIGLCMRQVVPSLTKILNYNPEQKGKKQPLPSRGKSWVKVKDLMRTYLTDVIALNQLLLEPNVVCATLRHTILLIPYFISFPKIAKVLLKFLVKTWSSADDESIRVLSFLCIIRIVKMEKKRYLDKVLKQTYLAYVANCKFTSPSLLPMINFMQQTLCELFAINPTVTYQLAFLYIRQLAIHLRKAMTIQKKENYQAVYNWQYVHCLGLWCRMVGNLYSCDEIKPLLYPLVQVSLGTIDLVPTARYFPLRYHIIRYLTSLSDATNTYIPLLPYITKPLRLAEFSKKKGENPLKPLTFPTILKLSNSQLKEGAYRSSTMDEVYFGLIEYINTQSHTISFPEMMVPTLVSLKKYIKISKVPAYIKLLRQVVDKVQENSKFILDKRSNVPFGVTDSEAVINWEQNLRVQGVPFHKHYSHYKKLHKLERRQEAADKNRIVEERLPVIDRSKFMQMSKIRDKEEFGELFADGKETVEDLEFNVEKIVEEEGREKRKTPRKRQEIEDSSDLEEDFEDDDDAGEDSYLDDSDEDSQKVDENSDDEIKQNSKPGKSEKTLKRQNEGKTFNNKKEKSKKKQKLEKIEDGEPDIVEDFRFSDED